MTGRSAPGESWRRAMAIVAERRAAGSKRRYQVYGYQVDEGWWAYSLRRAPKPPPVLKERAPMSTHRIEHLGRTLPRCAQRASARRGGGSKLALPSEWMAMEMARFLGVGFYRCRLPAPAIGTHWHLRSK